jgi:hypothetical protein
VPPQPRAVDRRRAGVKGVSGAKGGGGVSGTKEGGGSTG